MRVLEDAPVDRGRGMGGGGDPVRLTLKLDASYSFHIDAVLWRMCKGLLRAVAGRRRVVSSWRHHHESVETAVVSLGVGAGHRGIFWRSNCSCHPLFRGHGSCGYGAKQEIEVHVCYRTCSPWRRTTKICVGVFMPTKINGGGRRCGPKMESNLQYHMVPGPFQG